MRNFLRLCRKPKKAQEKTIDWLSAVSGWALSVGHTEEEIHVIDDATETSIS